MGATGKAGGLALVGGRSLVGLASEALTGAEVLQRHGTGGYTLPHRIDHAANLRRLAEAGCDRVLAIGSVGGLRADLGPGTIVCPDDFIALDTLATSRDGLDAHRVPGFDRGWRRRVIDAWGEAAPIALRDGGIYWQSRGPRLETPAEIRLIAAHADVIGMTIASECVVAGELGLAYAAVCVVDNLANGIGDEPLSLEQVEAGRDRNRERLAAALEAVIPCL